VRQRLVAAQQPCASGYQSQTFDGHPGSVYGCAGNVTYPNRATLCASGFHVCSSTEWSTTWKNVTPTHHYWVDDYLNYSGNGPGLCAADNNGTGNNCGATTPMRVCSASSGTDPEGNICNWNNCGLNNTSYTAGSYANQYFGGCGGNTTAGTLCCHN